MREKYEENYYFLSEKNKLDIKNKVLKIYSKNININYKELMKQLTIEIEKEIYEKIEKNDFGFFLDYVENKKEKEKDLEKIYTDLYYFIKNNFKHNPPQELLAKIIYGCEIIQKDILILCEKLDNDYRESNLLEKVNNPIIRVYLHIYLAQKELLIEKDEKSKYYLGLSKKELFERLENGDSKLLSEFMAANKNLVYKIALKYSKNESVSLDDLVQEGNIGFITGVKKYNYRLGFNFSTYVVNWISQAISRYLINNERVIRVPVHNVEKYNRHIKIINELTQRLGREPKDEEIRKVLGITPKEYSNYKKTIENISRINTSLSIDKPVEEDETYLYNVIPSKEKSVQDQIIENSLKEQLENILALLKPKEREILISRYGLDGSEPKTLEEIG